MLQLLIFLAVIALLILLAPFLLTIAFYLFAIILGHLHILLPTFAIVGVIVLWASVGLDREKKKLRGMGFDPDDPDIWGKIARNERDYDMAMTESLEEELAEFTRDKR